MRGGLEQVAGQAALAWAGTDGGEQAEERVGAEQVEVAVVEVAGLTEVGVGFEAGASGLRLGAIGAAQTAVVEGEQAALAGDSGALAEGVPEAGGDDEEAHEQQPADADAVQGAQGEKQGEQDGRGHELRSGGAGGGEAIVQLLVGGAEVAVVREDFFLSLGHDGVAGRAGHAFNVRLWECRVLRDVIPPTPPGPEGSNGNGLITGAVGRPVHILPSLQSIRCKRASSA